MTSYRVDESGRGEVPEGVTEIRDRALVNCTYLKSITLPDSVTKIGDYAFSNCTGLKSVVIPDVVTEIGNGAFYGCTGLTSITIPCGVTSIGYRAFEGCTGLTEITILGSVTEIRDWAFANCTGLPSLCLGSYTAIKVGLRHWQVGCKCETLDWWASDLGEVFATRNGYSAEEYTEGLLRLAPTKAAKPVQAGIKEN